MLVPAIAPSRFIDLNNANIVCDGNSLTAILGQPVAGATSYYGDIDDPYPVQLEAQLKLSYSGITIKNYGIGGQNMSNMIADAPTQIDPLIQAARPNILICWEITNSINSSSTTTTVAYNREVQYCSARKAAGWNAVVTMTALRREGSLGGQTIANFNTRLNTVNASMRANSSTFADALFDVAAIPEFATINSTYFLDLIHLNQAGHKRLVAGLIPVLKRLPIRAT